MKSKDRCKDILKYLYTSRFTDEKMNKLVKQNKGTTFFLSNQGHELIGILSAIFLDPKKDYSLPYYRDRAFVIALGSNLKDLFASFLARNSNHHSAGRMMPDHFSDNSLNIFCQSSVVASQFLHAVGIANALKKDEIVYVSAGNGATSSGDFHEALNFSAINKLSTLYVIQDNKYAISVTEKEQTAGELDKVFLGYENLKIIKTDGTDYIKTFKALKQATDYLRAKKGPVLLIAEVVRLKGHSNSDDQASYKTKDFIELEAKKDPLKLFENFLEKEKILDKDEIETLKKEIFDFVEKQAELALQVDFPETKTVQDKVFIDFKIEEKQKLTDKTITMMDGLNNALIEEMELDPNVIVFGEDVADNKGGVFKVTKSLTKKFGKDRCFNTPLAESTIIGLAIGMSSLGKKCIAEIQFADYTWSGINQLVNELASIYYRSNGQFHCPVVIRIPFGGYIQGGPYHSQSIESHLCHIPGLKVVVPSNAKDAKMLLKTAIQDPNPVVFLEHKAIYRQLAHCSTLEPTKDSYINFKANIVQKGEDLTIICYGMMVMFALEIAKKLSIEGFSIEVLDLRSLVPLDKEAILNSVKKTSKVIVLHEDKKFVGFGAEITSIIQEEAFDYLDAPVKRIGALDIPVPYAKNLEDAYFPQKEDIEREVRKLLAY